MKRIIILTGAVCVLLTACGNAENEVSAPDDTTTLKTETSAETAAVETETTAETAVAEETETPDELQEERILTPEDMWHTLDRSILRDDTFDISSDGGEISSKFVHYEIGGEHEGVRYFLEYIDDDSFYITFDNSENSFGRGIEVLVYDKTFPNTDDEVWSIDAANYYIGAGETVTKQYHIDGLIKEEKPLRFGIAIDDRGFNYENDRADIFARTGEFNLDITYYGIDNTAEYYDINRSFTQETLPEGFCSIV